MSGNVPSLFTDGISEEDAQARATSSMTIAVASASAPAPPYSTGMCGAWKSEARSASYEALGNSPVSSASAACGATRASQTSRTASRIKRWSSGRSYASNSLMPAMLLTRTVRAPSSSRTAGLGMRGWMPPTRLEAETHGVTIPYPTTNQPVPAFPAVEPPSGAARPRLAFLGTGYLGATYATCFAELGYEVLGFDVDAPKIAKLSGGQVPFHEPGLNELLRRNLAAGRLRFTTSYDDVAEFADVHFICVGTPQRRDGMGADLSYVESAVTNLAQRLSRRARIVGKSTVPVGTAEWIERLVAKHTDP